MSTFFLLWNFILLKSILVNMKNILMKMRFEPVTLRLTDLCPKKHGHWGIDDLKYIIGDVKSNLELKTFSVRAFLVLKVKNFLILTVI